MVITYGTRDSLRPETYVNTTSQSKEAWSKQLSPFLLGPVRLYGIMKAKSVENGWQFAKVYAQHTDQDGDPTGAYWKWATEGWQNPRGVRYPMGKGAAPEYHYWDGEKLDYITARKRIYIPLYTRAVWHTEAFQMLKAQAEIRDDLYLWDFDSYEYRRQGMTWEDAVNNPERPLGHAMVLAMLLENPQHLKDVIQR